MPERIRRSYADAIQVFNAGIWNATATCCRRTLEGVVAHLLGENNAGTPLAKSLEQLKETVDLAKPIHALSEVVRHGGNLGAHFDEHRELDEATARDMIDLLDYFLEYVFTLPALSEQVSHRIKSLGTDHKPDPD